MPAALYHFPTPAPTTCAACGQVLSGTYYVLIDRPERYCPTCIHTRPRCDTCGAPLTNQAWQLHDGRQQCNQCHQVAIYDLTLARQLFLETVQTLRERQGLVLRVGVDFRLVDAPTMRELRQHEIDESGTAPTPTRYERTLGLYLRQGRVRAIFLLHGLPRLIFRTTVAHEYAHAWQGEHCPLLTDLVLREGFAEWVAYRHLVQLGAHRAVARMLQGNHPYRPMLEIVLQLEAQLGTDGLMQYIRTVE
ncbi:MAG: protein DA1 [Chloroflexaceae bacterium]|nr:protein DA1 [Chloroflexaceae bacterium]